MEQNSFTQETKNQPKQNKAKKFFLVILLCLLVISLVGAGIYAWSQQQENKDLQAKNEQLLSEKQSVKETDNKNEATPLADFKIDSVPFIFKYPSSWTMEASEPLDNFAPAPDLYSVTLMEPGSDVRVSRFGNDYVFKGSRIIAYVAKTDLKDMKDRFTGIYQSATNREDITVSGIAAVQYDFGYESDPAVYTQLIKDGKMYTFAYYSDSKNEKDNKSYPSYKELVASIKFQ